ncbi:glycoside hydrolase family 65 protein [Legionella nagasakiensis]|uniref:glycoside hydrolase family 65 protein n=1 Tax=Legionella nagasakiensis TaxID=535290 RepID=UPI001A94E57D|nr:glycoside hydrolase family 65 protein [Legionella nagasakiensis]
MTDHSKKTGFTIEPWHIKAERFRPEQQLLLETLMAQANGYIGSRGSYEEALHEDIPSCEGVYLNGVYQQEPILYGESAYGFATHNQKMIQVPNGKRITLTVDGECLRACHRHTYGYRQLDLHTGVLTRVQHWTTQSGKQLQLKSRRFVSLADPYLMCIEYEVTAKNFTGSVQLTSALDANYQFQDNKDDPRVGCMSIADSLILLESKQQPQMNGLLHKIAGTDFMVASTTLDILPRETTWLEMTSANGECLAHQYQLMLNENQSLTFYKWVGYRHSKTQDDESNTLLINLQAHVENKAIGGFDLALEEHCKQFKSFWRDADVVIEGHSELQQGIRFNLFHLYQSVGRNGAANIGAKGLTGPGYDGHYFWDTEVYVIPTLCYTEPDVARKLIEFRISTLPQAKQRARQMSLNTGALYPWRTIGGEECSAFFPAGTAQYHINAAIAYALRCYMRATDDESLLWQGGAEMLFESARLWLHLGHFNARYHGKFCIDAVTGPDEYTAVVNNNFYTNVMAQMHLRYAVTVAKRLAAKNNDEFQPLASKIQLTADEINAWEEAAEHMYLPYDERLGIHMQDDAFLNKAVWNFANTPADKYPLLLHFHPLVIYRYQVLKQADVMLAMYLLDEQFSTEQKKRNLNYYEPLTTHDSSLSSCIHSIAYAETGDYCKAYQFFEDTVRMDLDNHHGNSEHGVHIACMAGSWASVVHGFAGLRVRETGLFFRPYLPNNWQGYRFNIRYRQQRLSVSVTADKTCYQLLDGSELVLMHFDQQLLLSPEHPSQVVFYSVEAFT